MIKNASSLCARELKRDKIMDYAGYYAPLITVALKSLPWWCLTRGGNIVSGILRNPLALCIFSVEIVTVMARMQRAQSETELYKKGNRLVYPWPSGYLWGLIFQMVVQLATFEVILQYTIQLCITLQFLNHFLVY